MKRIRFLRRFSLTLCAASLSACATAPHHEADLNALPLPASWTAAETADLFVPAQPADGQLKGDWWTLFGDEQLNALAAALLQHNQSLAVAAARLEQARAQASVTAAGLFPQLALQSSAARQKTSANRPLAAYNSVNQSTVQNNDQLGFSVSYEMDLSGRVHQAVTAARATEQQAAADFENTRLVLMAELVADYGNLRELDEEIRIVEAAILIQDRALKLIGDRHQLGIASGLDLAQQSALLDSTKTQLGLLQKQRQQFEHAVATMCGQAAPDFHLAHQWQTLHLPQVAAGVPSSLLQRRPDIASAQRAVAAANANIGVARAAYFPMLMWQANGGWNSTQFSNLLNAPSVLWALGASLTQTIFDGGKTRANERFAEAAYQATLAAYRQTVLTAMQEVEDGLQGSATLQRTAVQAAASVHSAERVLELANARYEGGVATYLDVVSAQQNLLNSQRQLAQIHGQQWLTTVYLIKALGGGWQNHEVGESG